jgi:hypothetical protein
MIAPRVHFKESHWPFTHHDRSHSDENQFLALW